MEGEIKRLKSKIKKLKKIEEKYETLSDYLCIEHGEFYHCDICNTVRHEEQIYDCKFEHFVCKEHGVPGWDNGETCPSCVYEREKHSDRAFLALLGCLKRKGCHKDVYLYVFGPIIQDMRSKAWSQKVWNIRK